MKHKPNMLMILDGYGLNDDPHGNAIMAANKPNLDKIFETYPNTSLKASGRAVGLPDGQIGNSEVGHLNIGAGRVVYQDLTKITKSIEDGDFFDNSAFAKAIEHVKKNNSTLHILGLLSDGGVHSHTSHLMALINLAKNSGIENLEIHCFLDGRDVPPKSARPHIENLEAYLNDKEIGKIATVSGRFYAMDRDKRWERLEKAYNAMTINEGLHASSATEALENAYARGESDEFVLPTIIDGASPVSSGDAMIMYNFRPDRAREITRAFIDAGFDGFERKAVLSDVCYVCMTQYDETMPNVTLAYPPETITNTLGEYISNLGMNQLRIAETEKYAHVTFFFNGGIEKPNENEDRILVPSPKVATYDLKPEMSAYEVTEKVLAAIDSDKYDVIILNFANADMVGHTGVMSAAIKAIEALDRCVPQIVEKILKCDGQILMTADHGNADVMLDENDNVVTAHSLNEVPLVHIAKNPCTLKKGGKLCDLAPTLLTLMGLEIPPEMTGESLVLV